MANAWRGLAVGFFLSATLATAQDPVVPLRQSSVWEKNLQHYWKQTHAPSSSISPAVGAAWSQWRNHHEEWGQGGGGFSARFGSIYGRRIVKHSVDLGVASLHGELLGYTRCERSGFWARTGHAVKSTFFRPTGSGGTTFALGRVAGAYGSGFAPMLWYPDSRDGAGQALARGSICLGFDVGKTVFREFWPDIKRRISGK